MFCVFSQSYLIRAHWSAPRWEDRPLAWQADSTPFEWLDLLLRQEAGDTEGDQSDTPNPQAFAFVSPCACFLQAPLIEAAKEFAADLTPSVGSQVRDKRDLLFGYIDFLPVSAGNGHREHRRPRVPPSHGAHISLLARGRWVLRALGWSPLVCSDHSPSHPNFTL